MILTYAGLPLSTPPADLMAWVANNISTKDVFDFERMDWPGKNLEGFAFPGMIRQRPIVPHTLFWPRGAKRFAVGYFFASAQTVARIRAYLGGSYQSLRLVMQDDLRPAIQTNLWVLPPRPLGTVGNGLYLLTLVDDRYWWWFVSASLTITANTTTWADLFGQIGTALGLTIQFDTIPSAYLKPSSGLTVNYEYLPIMLDAISYNVGQRIVRGLDGTVYSNNPVNGQNAVARNLTYYSVPKAGGALQVVNTGGLPFGTADAPAVLPATVQMTFPATGSGAPVSGVYAASATLASLNLTDLGIVGAPFVKVVHNSNTATFSGGMSPTNGSDLQILVNQFATDWYRFQASPLDVKYNGIIPWTPESLSESIEWMYSATPREMSTRIQRPAWNDLTEELDNGEPPAPPTPGGTGAQSDQDTRYCTILYAACDAVTTTITVQSTALFPAGGFDIQVDNEQMTVDSEAGNVWTVTRGVNGTTAAAHANYTPVCQVLPAIKTTLTSNVLIGDSTIAVDDTAQFPTWGRYYIRIDDEILLVYDGAGTLTWTVLRGQLGTTEAAHSSAAIVRHVLPDVVKDAVRLIFDDSDFLQPSTPDPDTGKPTATHHEVMQVIRITSPIRTPKGYFPGVLQKFDSVSNTFIDDVPVWVRDIQD